MLSLRDWEGILNNDSYIIYIYRQRDRWHFIFDLKLNVLLKNLNCYFCSLLWDNEPMNILEQSNYKILFFFCIVLCTIRSIRTWVLNNRVNYIYKTFNKWFLIQNRINYVLVKIVDLHIMNNKHRCGKTSNEQILANTLKNNHKVHNKNIWLFKIEILHYTIVNMKITRLTVYQTIQLIKETCLTQFAYYQWLKIMYPINLNINSLNKIKTSWNNYNLVLKRRQKPLLNFKINKNFCFTG